ncbi:hypothetical protein Tco_1515738 [Tanacetum coccineum]
MKYPRKHHTLEEKKNHYKGQLTELVPTYTLEQVTLKIPTTTTTQQDKSYIIIGETKKLLNMVVYELSKQTTRGEYKEVKDSQGSSSTQAQNEPSTSTYQHNQDKKQQRIVNEESLFIEGDDVVRADVDEEEMGSVLEMITGKMKMTYSEVDMVNLALKDFFIGRTHVNMEQLVKIN